MRCPRCGRTQTGQVGSREYYCWNCCVEFHQSPDGWRLFDVDEEGGLMEVAPDQTDPTAPEQAQALAQPMS